MKREKLQSVMLLAWQFVHKNGLSMSDALKEAWKNIKLRTLLYKGITKFYFQKVDGTMREAYGTLNVNLVPQTSTSDTRKKSDTVQTYFDTEKSEWRCFKKANLIKIAL